MDNHQDQLEEQEENLIEITYYTDPLCCWSWAFEPQWRKFRYDFRGKIKWRYRMCGMLPSWDAFDDPINSVSRPLQMGPVWMEAKHVSSMPMDDKIWFNDPPQSSFPACVAVKSAGLQSPEAEEWYLRQTREALMLHGKNIAKREVLMEVAQQLTNEKPKIFDADQFYSDFNSDAGNEAFRQDLQKARYHQIGRYPTLTMQNPGKTGVILTGYRPYPILLDALKEIAPEILTNQQDTSPEDYKKYWSNLTERELQEIMVETS